VPYRSVKQRRLLRWRKPEVAARWDARYGGAVAPRKRPRRRWKSKRS